MFIGPDPVRAIELMDQTGILHWILPEVLALQGCKQGKIHHPEGDAYVHTLMVVGHMEPRTVENMWAALLHDIAKPNTFKRRADGRITFYEHQTIGAEMAREIMERLKFSNDEIETVVATIQRHMDFINVQRMNKSTLRRFISAPTIENDLALHRADILGSMGKPENVDYIRAKMEEFQSGDGSALPPPLISGNDLIAMGLAPGPVIGKVLRKVQDAQLEGEISDREEALELAKKLLMETEV